MERGELEAARQDLERATAGAPDDHVGQAELAWLLATAPNEALRDGALALTRASRAGELCEWNDARVLQAFAAASAEAGDFASAVEWQRRAVELAPAAERSGYRAVLSAFEDGRPYRLP